MERKHLHRKASGNAGGQWLAGGGEERTGDNRREGWPVPHSTGQLKVFPKAGTVTNMPHSPWLGYPYSPKSGFLATQDVLDRRGPYSSSSPPLLCVLPGIRTKLSSKEALS